MNLTPQPHLLAALTNVRRATTLGALLLASAVLPAVSAAVPWLHVQGNQIVDANNANVLLRGYSILPPQHNGECHYCNNKPEKTIIDMATDATAGWYPTMLRIGVDNTNSALNNPSVLFSQYLDPNVQYAISKGVYVIVDLHLISDFDANNTGSGISQSLVLNFWKYVAPYYANTPNVIFEVYNEPIKPDDWTAWKNYIQPVVNAIRAVAPNNLIFMGGPQWSTRVNQAAASPVTGANIAYVYHIYPNQGSPTAANLDSKFGTAAQSIPVVVTEFGWNSTSTFSDRVTNGTTSAWGQPFRTYMDAHRNISWCSFIFDDFWKPEYFDHSWNLLTGENQGAFMKQWLTDLHNGL